MFLESWDVGLWQGGKWLDNLSKLEHYVEKFNVIVTIFSPNVIRRDRL
jgi:hypothetical protein